MADDRETKIAKLLREAGTSSVALTLMHDGAQLGRWDRNEWSDALPAIVDAEMLAHHEALGERETGYTAALVDADGSVRKQRFLVVKTPRGLMPHEPIAPQLDGTVGTTSALQQQVLYKMVALYSQSIDKLLQAQNETIRTLSEMVRQNETRVTTARDEYHALREIVADLRVEPEAEPQEMSPAQAKVLELVQAALPMILARLSAGTPKAEGSGTQ